MLTFFVVLVLALPVAAVVFCYRDLPSSKRPRIGGRPANFM
jgi:hypothetical protein